MRRRLTRDNSEYQLVTMDSPGPRYLPRRDWHGWRGFLRSCEVRGQAGGVIYYGHANCNYLVFPDGSVVCNYGYHGRVLLRCIREVGAAAVLAKLRRHRRVLDQQ